MDWAPGRGEGVAVSKVKGQLRRETLQVGPVASFYFVKNCDKTLRKLPVIIRLLLLLQNFPLVLRKNKTQTDINSPPVTSS